jgi:Tol biopolymer transport system component
MDADGRNPKQITSFMSYHPTISADGQTLTFETAVKGLFRPVRMPSAGGEIETLLDTQAARAVYSFDGKKIMIGRVTTERGPDLEQTVILDARTRARLQTLEGTHWSFTPDGTGLLFLGKYNGTMNLMVRPLAKGSPYPLTTLRDERVHGFAISADGKRLAIVRAKEELDAVLITNFR